MTSHTHRALAALGVAVALSLGSATRTAAQSPQQQAVRVTGNDAAVAKARADSARYAYTAADIQFMSGMIAHHAQAIAMARWAPTHGAGDELKRLAERIINAQTDEIAIMQTWLRDRNQPVPEAKPGPMKMMMNGMEHEMLMPGMLTDEQMKELDSAQGPEFDKHFLRFMIQHHTGAITMVKELFSTYGAGQDETVFKFATDVNVDQTTEIARMEKMLAALVFGVTLP